MAKETESVETYELTTEIYKSRFKRTLKFTDFSEAIRTAEYVSELLNKTLGLTRQDSFQEPVRHMSNYFDLYNEVAIKLTPLR